MPPHNTEYYQLYWHIEINRNKEENNVIMITQFIPSFSSKKLLD